MTWKCPSIGISRQNSQHRNPWVDDGRHPNTSGALVPGRLTRCTGRRPKNRHPSRYRVGNGKGSEGPFWGPNEDFVTTNDPSLGSHELCNYILEIRISELFLRYSELIMQVSCVYARQCACYSKLTPLTFLACAAKTRGRRT